MKKLFDRVFIGAIAFVLALGPCLAADTATLLPNARQVFLDNSGRPLSSGKVYFYTPATSTPKTVWSNSTKTTALTQPVTLDSSGRPSVGASGVGIYGDGSYRQVLQTSTGVTIWDGLTASTGSGGGDTTVGDGIAVGTIMPFMGFSEPTNYLFANGQAINRTTYNDLFLATTFIQSISCVIGSTTLGVSNSSVMGVGQAVEASCLAPGTTVVSAATSTTVVVSSAATSSIGTTMRVFPNGNGDGSLTFNVPDLRGRIPAGVDAMGGTSVTSRITAIPFGGGTPLSVGATGGSQANAIGASQLPSFSGILAGNQGTVSTTLSGGSTYIQLNGNATSLTNLTASFTGTGTPFGVIQPTIMSNWIIKAVSDNNGGFSPSGGTVTSIGLAMPGIFNVSGSPITTTGTIAATLATQSANLVWAGPLSGAAAVPTFRALSSGDLPSAFGAQQVFTTRALAAAATIPAIVSQIYIEGYYTAGIGGAFYIRSASLPPHTAYFQSADGAYWELAQSNAPFKFEQFGGACSGTGFDNTTFLNVYRSYITTYDSQVLEFGPCVYYFNTLPATYNSASNNSSVYLVGKGGNSTLLIKTYNGDFLKFEGTGGNVIRDMSIAVGTGTGPTPTTGTLLNFASTSSLGSSSNFLSNLTVGALDTATVDYSIVFDGSLKVTGAVGTRDNHLLSIFTQNVYIRDPVGFDWFGGEANAITLIGSVTADPNYIAINVASLAGVTFTHVRDAKVSSATFSGNITFDVDSSEAFVFGRTAGTVTNNCSVPAKCGANPIYNGTFNVNLLGNLNVNTSTTINAAVNGVATWLNGAIGGTNTPVLGPSGTATSLTFANATSGTIVVQPVTGALGSVTLSLPATTGTFALLDSPAFTNNPTAPTQSAGNNSTRLATTAFVATSFAPLASPALTGVPTAPTPGAADNSTKIATTAFVQAALPAFGEGVQAYDTVAAATAATVPSTPTIYVRGYSTAGGLGAGYWTRSASVPGHTAYFQSADGAYWSPSLANKLFDFEMFGGSCGGSGVDNTPALNKVNSFSGDSGGVAAIVALQFAGCTYYFNTQPNQWSDANQSRAANWRGTGKNGTSLANSNNGDFLVFNGVGGNVIRDMQICSIGAKTTGNLLGFTSNATNSSNGNFLENISALSCDGATFDYGIVFDGQAKVTGAVGTRDNSLLGIFSKGLLLRDVVGFDLNGGVLSNGASSSIDIISSAGSTFHPNYVQISLSASSGVTFQNITDAKVQATTFAGNITFDATTDFAWVIGRTSSVTVTNNCGTPANCGAFNH